MKIRSITVEARETVSLPGYNNISRGVALVADIDEQDEWSVCHDALSMLADSRLREEIDEALEASDCPPKYFNGDRYGVAVSGQQRRIGVVPAGRNLPSGWYWEQGAGCGFREATARRLAERGAAQTGYTIHAESDVRNLPGAATFNPGPDPTPEECF